MRTVKDYGLAEDAVRSAAAGRMGWENVGVSTIASGEGRSCIIAVLTGVGRLRCNKKS